MLRCVEGKQLLMINLSQLLCCPVRGDEVAKQFLVVEAVAIPLADQTAHRIKEIKAIDKGCLILSATERPFDHLVDNWLWWFLARRLASGAVLDVACCRSFF